MAWSSKLTLEDNIAKNAAAAKEYLELLQEVSELRMQGYSLKLIALIKSVSRPTVYKWMEDPLYKSLYVADFSDSIESHKDGLIGALPLAVKAARDILDNPNCQPSDKLNASSLILGYGSKIAAAVQAIADSSDENGLIPIPREKPDVSK